MKTIIPIFAVQLFFTAFAHCAYADYDTADPNGIDSIGLTIFNGQTLDGSGTDIGQVELTRSGRPMPQGGDNFQRSNSSIMPAAVYLRDVNSPPPANQNIDNHAEYVAGVMISTDPLATGGCAGCEFAVFRICK